MFLAGVNVSCSLLEMVGFQMSINGRFWVSTEADVPPGEGLQVPANPHGTGLARSATL